MRGTVAKRIRREVYQGRDFRDRKYKAVETGAWTVQVSTTQAILIKKHTVEADPYRQLYQETKRRAKGDSGGQ